MQVTKEQVGEMTGEALRVLYKRLKVQKASAKIEESWLGWKVTVTLAGGEKHEGTGLDVVEGLWQALKAAAGVLS